MDARIIKASLRELTPEGMSSVLSGLRFPGAETLARVTFHIDEVTHAMCGIRREEIADKIRDALPGFNLTFRDIKFGSLQSLFPSSQSVAVGTDQGSTVIFSRCGQFSSLRFASSKPVRFSSPQFELVGHGREVDLCLSSREEDLRSIGKLTLSN